MKKPDVRRMRAEALPWSIAEINAPLALFRTQATLRRSRMRKSRNAQSQLRRNNGSLNRVFVIFRSRLVSKVVVLQN